MKGTLTRVFALYPMALPMAFVILSTLFPGYVAYDEVAQRVTITFTLAEVGAAVALAYGFIAAVFAKWGIKR